MKMLLVNILSVRMQRMQSWRDRSSERAQKRTPPDSDPPNRSAGSPSTELVYTTTSTSISLTTNENATCKYSLTANTSYAGMTGIFLGAGTTSHTATVSGLTSGNSYSYYVRCQDTPGNANTGDYPIQFSVGTPPDSDPPNRSAGNPSTELVYTPPSTSISLTTNENATCKYSLTANTSYAGMTGIFLGAGTTSHTATVSGLTSGNSYSYYVRCQDTPGNANIGDYPIQFSVAGVPDAIDPSRSAGSPTGELVYTTTSTSISLATNENATCKYSVGSDATYAVMAGTFSGAGTKAHTATVSGLASGGNYSYYARCQDALGNTNLTGYPIEFSVAVPPAPAPAATSSSSAASSSSSSPSSSSASKKGDFNGDNNVNIIDLSILLSNWNKSVLAYDLGGSAILDIFDLSILLS